jgi:arylsulfate sulfotransferase
VEIVPPSRGDNFKFERICQGGTPVAKSRSAAISIVFFICIASSFFLAGCGGTVVWPTPTVSIGKTSNPLVAQYNIFAPHIYTTAWVEFGEDTSYGRQTSTTAPTTSAGQPIQILVAGMKADTTYHMRGHFDWPGGSSVSPDQTFATGALPFLPLGSTGRGIPAPGLSVSQPNPNLSPSPGVELVNATGETAASLLGAYVTDLQGNIIWYYTPPNVGPLPTRPLANGHFVSLNGTSALSQTDVIELDLLGNTIRDISLAQVNGQLAAQGYNYTLAGFHHDVLPLPSGHWIVLANTYKSFTDLPGYPGVTRVLGDVLIDIDLNGNVDWVWSAFDHLDVNRHPMSFPDWTHCNAILYTPNDGNLLLSSRHQSWVIKIDYQNGAGAGDILWKLGYQGDFQLPDGTAPGQWFFAQHFPSITTIKGSQISLALFDNGDDRVVDDNGDICGSSVTCYSRAASFQLDESTKAANLQWADTPGFYSYWGGGAQQVSNGNMEFDLTSPTVNPESIVMEVTRTNTPQTVWQMTITGENAYRAYRIPSLYPGVTWQK